MTNLRHATLTWSHQMVFSGGATDGPAIPIDGDGSAGPSPMLLLLLAAGSCTGSDIVSILERMRVELRSLTIDVTGTRREDLPRRYVALHLRFRLSGAALDRDKAQRAIDLSLEKYCSVVHTLAPDLAVTQELVLE
jgi:putative redox protein